MFSNHDPLESKPVKPSWKKRVGNHHCDAYCDVAACILQGKFKEYLEVPALAPGGHRQSQPVLDGSTEALLGIAQLALRLLVRHPVIKPE